MLKPQKDYMIVERYIQTKSNLVLPDDQQPSSDEIFKVVTLGPGIDKKIATEEGEYVMDIKEGDLIFIVGYITKLNYNGKTYLLARAKDVVAVARGDDEKLP